MQGFDINPMSAWIVREEIEHLDIAAYERAARSLITASTHRHRPISTSTSCPVYGDADVPVKSFLWVKVLDCEACGKPFDLFPGYLLAENRRHPKNVIVCHGLRGPQRGPRSREPWELRRMRSRTHPNRTRTPGTLQLPPLWTLQCLSRRGSAPP